MLLSQGLTPVAFLLSPSKMNFPVDLALGVMLPLHGETEFGALLHQHTCSSCTFLESIRTS